MSRFTTKPTPTIGAVGLIANESALIAGTAEEGDALVLIGAAATHLGQSALLAEFAGVEAGDAPGVDLAAEKAHGDFIRAQAGRVHAVTDVSDGGMALAAFELAEAAQTGLELGDSDMAALFGEDQARYLVATVDAHGLIKRAEAAGVPASVVGRFGGDTLRIGGVSAPMAELAELYRGAFAKALA